FILGQIKLNTKEEKISLKILYDLALNDQSAIVANTQSEYHPFFYHMLILPSSYLHFFSVIISSHFTTRLHFSENLLSAIALQAIKNFYWVNLKTI
ncbi:hypothetical protein SASC598J21_003040, partial [Snodgrassella alvi SCGC AB-598-J21]